MGSDTIYISPHGYCNIVHEHGQEWAICRTCGAEWSLPGGNGEPEQISEGDGYCDERGD